MTEAQPPRAGEIQDLEPGLRCLLAPNPSPMTYWGTNTYILGTEELCVIDPGPDSAPHLEAILAATEAGQPITKIVVTHAHLDHSPLARPLADATGARIYAFGDAQSGRSEVMSRLADSGYLGGGEGVDASFAPDIQVSHGDVIDIEHGQLEVLHTPGHFGNHISLAWGDACFTGDHVMGWASSLVSPPDGDLTDFMTSCRLLTARDWRIFYSGHGAPITDPNARINWLITHRQSREADIQKALAKGPASAPELAQKIYTDVDPRLLPAAARNVFAHLIDLAGRGLVQSEQGIEFNAPFSLC